MTSTRKFSASEPEDHWHKHSHENWGTDRGGKPILLSTEFHNHRHDKAAKQPVLDSDPVHHHGKLADRPIGPVRTVRR
jgi:hypothetical protein